MAPVYKLSSKILASNMHRRKFLKNDHALVEVYRNNKDAYTGKPFYCIFEQEIDHVVEIQ